MRYPEAGEMVGEGSQVPVYDALSRAPCRGPIGAVRRVVMRLSTNVLAVLLMVGISGTAWAQGTGRSLDIQPGGRQNGMGCAGVALADDPTAATWWNPAGLGFVGRSAIELTYAQLVPTLADDVVYNYGTFVHPVQGWGAFAIGFVFLSYGQSEGADAAGNPTGPFSPNRV